MRAVFSVLSLLFMGIVGCGTTEHPSPEVSRVAEATGGDGQPVICPAICGLGTLCEFPDGSCTEVCNSCYCMADGGTVVNSCRNGEAAKDSLPQASTVADNSVVGADLQCL
jgi:hypothetical protein